MLRLGPPRLALVLLLPLLALAASGAAGRGDGGGTPGPAAGIATITEPELAADLAALATPAFEGRDSPSLGLQRAGDHIIERLRAAGLTGAGKDGAFRLPFERTLPAPVPEDCALAIVGGEGSGTTFAYGTDFVPVWLAGGRAEGEAVFYAYGIDDDDEKYDDITGDVRGTIAVIVEGEPRHKKKFEGPEVSAASQLYAKLAQLQRDGAAGALIVRRLEGAGAPPLPLAFRHTWASWAGLPPDAAADAGLPALEISPQAAQRLVGLDVLAAAAAVDKTAKPPKPVRSGRTVAMSSATAQTSVPIDNIVAVLRGNDERVANEYVVVGAHYDHVGVDTRGRVGCGADDNASGSAAMLEVVSALAAAGPRRSILACAFAAEEDGLLGSQALCEHLPVPKASLVAMLNLDMVGRGEAGEVAVLGLLENPKLEDVLERAKKLQPTKIKSIVMRQGQDLFARSDHYSFHRIGVPVLFFFEGLPIDKNPDYHTWRDTIDLVDVDKVGRTARLVFNTAWLLADDDERPPKPGAAGK